jgi:hypothetical protein
MVGFLIYTALQTVLSIIVQLIQFVKIMQRRAEVFLKEMNANNLPLGKNFHDTVEQKLKR